jgi:hypothetical protein
VADGAPPWGAKGAKNASCSQGQGHEGVMFLGSSTTPKTLPRIARRKASKKSKWACSQKQFLAPGSARDERSECGHVMLHGPGQNPTRGRPGGNLGGLPRPGAKSQWDGKISVRRGTRSRRGVPRMRAAVRFKALTELCLCDCHIHLNARHRIARKKGIETSKSACSPKHFHAPVSARDYRSE